MRQVLRDRRERDSVEHLQDMRERPMSVPLRPNMHVYGSHPDLTSHELTEFVERQREIPTYMPYQTGSKMYSSLTKIQNREPPKSPEKPPRKIKIRRRQDNQKVAINTNYLRPLTPHLPFNSSSTPRTEGFGETEPQLRSRPGNRRSRSNRPASSIDFTGGDRDRILEQFSSHRSDLNSPRGHPGESRARDELHLSLQRLLAERDRTDTYEREPLSSRGSYFEPLDVSSIHEQEHGYKVHIPDSDYHNNGREFTQLHSSQGDQFNKSKYSNVIQNQEEDYGIYGDDDDDDDTYKEDDPRQKHILAAKEMLIANPPTGDTKKTRSSIPSREQMLAMSLVQSLGDQQDADATTCNSLEDESSSPQTEKLMSTHSTESETNSDRNESSSSLSIQEHHKPSVTNESSISLSIQEQHKPSYKSESSSSIQEQHKPSASVMESPRKPHGSEPPKPPRTMKHNLSNVSLDKGPILQSREIVDFETHAQELNISTSKFVTATGTLERAKKYVVHSDKSELEDNVDGRKMSTEFSDINKNDVIVDNIEELKVSSADIHEMKNNIPSVVSSRSQTWDGPKPGIPSGVSDNTITPSPRGRKGSGTERIPKKLPILHGRHSTTTVEDIQRSRIPSLSSPSSPTATKPGLVKDTKIPLYTPHRYRKDKGPTSPRDPMSKSTEDISKLKKKMPFKQSIKNFLGRKRYVLI